MGCLVVGEVGEGGRGVRAAASRVGDAAGGGGDGRLVCSAILALMGEPSFSGVAKNAKAGIRLLELVSCDGGVGAGREEGGEWLVRGRGSFSANFVLDTALVCFCTFFTFGLVLALLATLLS